VPSCDDAVETEALRTVSENGKIQKSNNNTGRHSLGHSLCSALRGRPDTWIGYDFCIIRILLLGDFRLGDCREKTTLEISQQWYFSTLPEKGPWPCLRPRAPIKDSASATPLTAAPSTGSRLVCLTNR
jgi:hypothetical protein